MGHACVLAGLAGVLVLWCACPAAALLDDGIDACADTFCTDGFVKLPLSSPSHPSKTGLCNECGAGDGCRAAAGSCRQCCYKRTCANYYGIGKSMCPYGYVTSASADAPPADAGAAELLDACCTGTIDNAFPPAKDTFAGAVQALSDFDTNWGFDEDSANFPTTAHTGFYTGMCFRVLSTFDCDGTETPECCQPRTKPAFLQFKLPVPAAMAAQGEDPRYAALSKLSRCRLSYARVGSRAIKKLTWRIASRTKGSKGGAPEDARYASILLNFGADREATMCVYTADIQADVDCSWENLCGLRPNAPNYVGGPDAADDSQLAKGCEVRLIGHARSRVGPTETSKCVGPTYSVFDYEGASDYPDGGGGDVNECSSEVNPCGPNTICTNTTDSFTCACATGWRSPTEDGRDCTEKIA